MNTNITAVIEEMVTKIDGLKRKDPQACLALLKKLNAAISDLNQEFETLKQLQAKAQ